MLALHPFVDLGSCGALWEPQVLTLFCVCSIGRSVTIIHTGLDNQPEHFMIIALDKIIHIPLQLQVVVHAIALNVEFFKKLMVGLFVEQRVPFLNEIVNGA